MAAKPEPIVRPPVRIVDVHDGDTYLVLVDWKLNRFGPDASQARVRLRDYSCPELKQPGSDGLLSGAGARDVAVKLLNEAGEVLVEFKGRDSLGRDVCWVWIDGESLGEQLAERKAARPGAFMG